MNKQYSVDDILLEIKAKKSKQGTNNSVPAGFPVKKAEAPVVNEAVQETIANPVKEAVKESSPLDGFHFNAQSAPKELP